MQKIHSTIRIKPVAINPDICKSFSKCILISSIEILISISLKSRFCAFNQVAFVNILVPENIPNDKSAFVGFVVCFNKKTDL